MVGAGLCRAGYSTAPQSVALSKEFLGAFEETFAHGRVLLAAKSGKLLELLALFGIQTRRHFDNQPGEQVAALTPVDVNDSLAAEFKYLSALGSGRHLEIRFALQRGHVHFSAKRSAAKRDWHFAIKIIVLALENFVFLDVNDDIEIAMRRAASAGFAIA